MRAKILFDQSNLCPEVKGIRFNPSIIEVDNGYLFLFRNSWIGSQLYLARLDNRFQPTGMWKHLELPKTSANKGKEDGRLFRLNGQLYVSYTGFTGTTTSVLYARLNPETLAVDHWFWPQYPNRNKYEKNWVFFDHDGATHCVYSSNVIHHVIAWEDLTPGLDPTPFAHFKTPFNVTYSMGCIRGGCSPVLHNGEWYHFFHGVTYDTDDKKVYSLGCYTFEAKPPFKVTRYTPDPLDVGDPRMDDPYEKPNVIFPGGAVLVGNEWGIAMGINDKRSEIRFYETAQVERALVKYE